MECFLNEFGGFSLSGKWKCLRFKMIGLVVF